MSSLDVALILFQVVVLFFTISVQECAHAWVAWRLGDPTGKMMGRITLNPLKHLDLFGSVLIPAISLLYGVAIIGWGKPVEVTPRNFKNYRRDDVLTALAGPGSNLALATLALIFLIILKHTIAGGGLAVGSAIAIAFHFQGIDLASLPPLFPIALLLYFTIIINVTLMVFNLIPIPPLDGSRILRNYLSYEALKIYDGIGIWWMIIFFLFAGRILSFFYPPILAIFNGLLAAL